MDLETQIEELQDEVASLQDELSEKKERIIELEIGRVLLFDELEENNIAEDISDDCRRSLFFALEELKEVEQGYCTLEDKIRDLTFRHCRFIKPIPMPEQWITQKK